MTLVAAAAVALAVAISAVVMYVVVQQTVNGQVDTGLRNRADDITLRHQVQTIYGTTLTVTPVAPGAQGFFAQVISADGQVGIVEPNGAVVAPDSSGTSFQLPVTPADKQVAANSGPDIARTVTLGQVPYRIYTTPLQYPSNVAVPGFALEIGRSVADANGLLTVIRLLLFLIAAAGVALAGVLGWFIARAGLWPIARLRATVDHVTTTGDLTQRVREGEDELGLLGAHFNHMLAALDQSLRTQRQLVADASHELRTPLASLRTNVEVLQRRPDLELDDRDLLRDVVAQVEQLTRLIGDLIDLARGEHTPEEKEEVRLDWVVASALERAALGWPAVRFEERLQDSTIVGQPSRVERAIANLLDNAGKWSPAGGVVEVGVTDHEVTVRDHGPGIDQSDLPHIFDRFWRAPGARALPGSGLGLSIVRQVADSHGAVVTAELPPDGGTLMRLRFPAPPEPPKQAALPRRRLPLPGRVAS